MASEAQPHKTLGILLFDGFELLDAYGPAEMFCGMKEQLRLVMIAERAGEVQSAQGPRTVADVGFEDCPPLDLLLVPGGIGTRKAIHDEPILSWLREQAAKVEILMTVCTGSGLAAKAGSSTASGPRRTRRVSRGPVPTATRSSGCAKRGGSTMGTA